jgi:hypothetical protein
MTVYTDLEGDLDGSMPENMDNSEYLARSNREPAKRIRRVINDWLSRYPASEQHEIIARLHSRNEQDHQSAFFELMIHEIFISQGWQGEAHPDIPNSTRKPDFKFSKNNQEIIVEAKIVMRRSAEEHAAIRRLNTMLDTINRHVSAERFFIGINTVGLPNTEIRSRLLATRLQAWLSQLDYNQALTLMRQGTPEIYNFQEGDFSVVFEALPRNPEQATDDDRVIGVMNYGHDGGWLQTGTSLKGAIENKARAYGQFNMPYIIATNVWEFYGDIASDSLEALYGSEQIQHRLFVNGDNELTETRAEDGCFGTPSNPRKTNVSGVLAVNNASPWAVANRKLVYIPHVWSSFPMHSPVENTLNAVYNSDLDGFQYENSGLLYELLNLPEHWPLNDGDDDS